jgi:replication-associated recombination protein RarA
MFIEQGKGIQMISDVTVESCEQKRPKPSWKEPKPLLAEILRPQNLGDLTLPAHTIQRLQRVMETGSMMNMLFYGPPGSGKTSAATMLGKAIGGYRLVDRSSKTSPNLAKYIEDYARYGRDEACIVDQAHFIPKRDQTPLPDIIDRLSRHCPFVFAATDIKKLIPTLRSRLTEISFEVAREEREEVQKRVMKRYENILPANGFKFDKVRLEQIVDANFPDLRSIANNIEFEFG